MKKTLILLPPFTECSLQTITKKLLILIALFIVSIQLIKAQSLYNTFTGDDAGANSTGDYNSFYGYHSGYSNIGNSNVSIGYKSGYFHEGKQNTWIGRESGYSSNGDYNIGFGYACGSNNTGDYNIFNGSNAGWGNQGNHNIFNGNSSGLANIGDYNIFNGYSSGQNNEGNHNIFSGRNSGYKNEGSYNIFGGNSTGYNNTGNYNIFTGDSSGYNNTTGSYNTFLGNKAGKSNTTGFSNIFIGNQSGKSNKTGTYNIYIGHSADGSDGILGSVSIGYNAKVTASNAIVLGNGNCNVGIGVSAPTYRLQLSSNSAAKPGSSTWTIASDKRLKKDISDFTDGLRVLEKIHPVWFSYNGEAGMPVDKKFVGIIAQEMKETAPYMVGTFNYQDSTGNQTEYLDYDANALLYILVNSVKEQQTTIDKKDKELSELKTALTSLQLEVEELKNLILSSTNINTSSIENISECCDASLEQNFPNPFSQSTTIKYNINTKAGSAILVISSLHGIEISRYTLPNYGSGEITIPANTLASGTYFYQLLIDGKQVDVKQMELIK